MTNSTKSLPVRERSAGPKITPTSVGNVRMYMGACEHCGARIETGSSIAAVDFTLEHAHLKDVA